MMKTFSTPGFQPLAILMLAGGSLTGCATLDPPLLEDWIGQGFDFQSIDRFLAVVRDHPALLAYLGLHERRMEPYTAPTLSGYY